MCPYRGCRCDRQPFPRRRARVGGLCGFPSAAERVPAKYQKTGRCVAVQERCKNEKGDKMSTEFYCEEFPAEQNGKQVQTLKDLLEACPEVHNLKLAARFTTRTPANWKNIVDNYLECYHCGPAHPGFSDSVQVDRYWHTMHGNWTLQYGFAKPSEQSFKFEEGTDAAFHGFWLWPCTMLNVTPLKGMMTVIYEFPVDSETTLQNYDIYFTNEELTDEQKSLIEWYRDVFRPEDLRLVESVQKGLKSRGYRGQGRIMADSSGSGISEHGIAHFHNLLAQVFKD